MVPLFLFRGKRLILPGESMVTQTTIRMILRWLHLILGLVVMCYIYSPFHELRAFQIAIKFVVLPVITFSGLWIWKFKAFNKFFGIRE